MEIGNQRLLLINTVCLGIRFGLQKAANGHVWGFKMRIYASKKPELHAAEARRVAFSLGDVQESDPFRQFEWLEDQLRDARQFEKKAGLLSGRILAPRPWNSRFRLISHGFGAFSRPFAGLHRGPHPAGGLLGGPEPALGPEVLLALLEPGRHVR